MFFLYLWYFLNHNIIVCPCILTSPHKLFFSQFYANFTIWDFCSYISSPGHRDLTLLIDVIYPQTVMPQNKFQKQARINCYATKQISEIISYSKTETLLIVMLIVDFTFPRCKEHRHPFSGIYKMNKSGLCGSLIMVHIYSQKNSYHYCLHVSKKYILYPRHCSIGSLIFRQFLQ